MGLTGTTSQPAPSTGTTMKMQPGQAQTNPMKTQPNTGPVQPGGIAQGVPGLNTGLFTGSALGQGYRGMGQGFQGAQGPLAPGSSQANPTNPLLGGGGMVANPIMRQTPGIASA